MVLILKKIFEFLIIFYILFTTYKALLKKLNKSKFLTEQRKKSKINLNIFFKIKFWKYFGSVSMHFFRIYYKIKIAGKKITGNKTTDTKNLGKN